MNRRRAIPLRTLRGVANRMVRGKVTAALDEAAKEHGVHRNTVRRRLAEAGLLKAPARSSVVVAKFAAVMERRGANVLTMPTRPDMAAKVECGECGHVWTPLAANVVYKGTGCPKCSVAKNTAKRLATMRSRGQIR